MQSLPPGQATQDPLAGLRDIHLPEPVSWWPLAIGWWLVAGLVLLAVFFLYWKRRCYLRSLARYAKLELLELQENFEKEGNALQLAEGLAELLRRVALVRYPREDVASLHGEQWVKFLLDHNGGSFAEEFQLLEDALYAPPKEMEDRLRSEGALQAVRSWIRRNAA